MMNLYPTWIEITRDELREFLSDCKFNYYRDDVWSQGIVYRITSNREEFAIIDDSGGTCRIHPKYVKGVCSECGKKKPTRGLEKFRQCKCKGPDPINMDACINPYELREATTLLQGLFEWDD